jgi:hypothetical protein
VSARVPSPARLPRKKASGGPDIFGQKDKPFDQFDRRNCISGRVRNVIVRGGLGGIPGTETGG